MFLPFQLISIHQYGFFPAISKFQRFLEQGAISFAIFSSRLTFESNAFRTNGWVNELLRGVLIYSINGIERDIRIIIVLMTFLIHLEPMVISSILEEGFILSWGVAALIGLCYYFIFEMRGIRDQPIHGRESGKGFFHAVVRDKKQSLIASRKQVLEVLCTPQKGGGIGNPFVNVFLFPRFIHFFIQKV